VDRRVGLCASGMDSNTVPADVRWAIANFPDGPERGAVSSFCRRNGISRSALAKIRSQAREKGPVGATEPGSRRPPRSPGRIDPGVIEHALAVRAWLVGQGLDAGPLSVVARMRRQGLNPPSRATRPGRSPPPGCPGRSLVRGPARRTGGSSTRPRTAAGRSTRSPGHYQTERRSRSARSSKTTPV
jgi:hypothetical protein